MNPLTEDEREALREMLTGLETELAARIADAASGTEPVSLDEPIGRLSRMDAMQQQEMTAATKRGFERRLVLVRAGLARLRAGDFGDCIDCEEPIAYRRLAARPEARRCTACQGAADKR